MPDFNSVSLLQIDQQSVSLGQALTYLQMFGRLTPFIQEVVRYHALLQEFQSRDDLAITTADLGQAILDFRLNQGLTDQADFQQWLANQGLDYAALESQTVIALKLEKFKSQLAASGLEQLFGDCQTDFEQVDLYYLLVSEEALAYQLKDQIEGGETFDQIARHYPISAGVEPDIQTVIVKRDILKRQQLREEIKVAIATTPAQTLVGPIPMGTRWCLCRIEQILPAVLDDQLRQGLREQLFEQWLSEKLQTLKVEPANSSSSSEISSDPSPVNRDPQSETSEGTPRHRRTPPPPPPLKTTTKEAQAMA